MSRRTTATIGVLGLGLVTAAGHLGTAPAPGLHASTTATFDNLRVGN